MPDAVMVGKQLKLLRKHKGMTQAQLADRLKISYQSISKWESGISLPTKQMLGDIASVFETSVDFILQGD